MSTTTADTESKTDNHVDSDDASDDDGATTHFRTCPLCEATCGLEITMAKGRVKRIRGDRDDVFSHGFICPKGSTLKQLHEDPDRLRRPLVKRDGEFVEVSWDEAFAVVAQGLAKVQEQGEPNAVAVYLGNPSAHTLAGTLFVRPLIQALRTQNLYSASTVDQMPKHASSGWMFGNSLAMPVPDLDRTQYLLILGANPWESNGSLCTAPDFPGRVAAMQERGGRMVVVDPRRTRTAQAADEHVAIRPGTDALWLCALANEILGSGLADLGDLADRVQGLEELTAELRRFTPEAVAQACGVDAAVTRRIAQELAAAPSAAVYGRIGTHTVEFGTLASWAVDVLNVITGNLDRPGGAMFPRPAHRRPPTGGGTIGRGFETGRWRSRVLDLPEVRGEMPVATLADEIETPGPGQIRALFTVAGNPALSNPNSERLDAALASLELMVSVDIYLNETTRHAHVILPPPSALERGHYDVALYGTAIRNVANYSPPVIPTDAMAEEEILARLALIASGQGPTADPEAVYGLMVGGLAAAAVKRPGAPLHGRDPEELVAAVAHRPPAERVLDMMLRCGADGDHFGATPGGLSLDVLLENPHGVDLGALTSCLDEVLRTPSGKIELATADIVADLARLVASLGSRDADELLLVGRRHLRSNNSWMHNIGVLVKGKERCTLQVHPDDATRLGLVHGGSALVASRAGKVVAPVEVTDDIRAGVVSLPHGWGHTQAGTQMATAQAHAGVNSNVLTDESVIDPLSGNAQLNAIPVTVSPA